MDSAAPEALKLLLNSAKHCLFYLCISNYISLYIFIIIIMIIIIIYIYISSINIWVCLKIGHGGLSSFSVVKLLIGSILYSILRPTSTLSHANPNSGLIHGGAQHADSHIVAGGRNWCPNIPQGASNLSIALVKFSPHQHPPECRPKMVCIPSI